MDALLDELSRRPLAPRLLLGGGVAAVLAVVALMAARRPERTPPPKPVSVARQVTNFAAGVIDNPGLSPDGGQIAYGRGGKAFVRDLRTDATRELPQPAGLSPGVISWFPDGDRIVASF